MPKAKRSHTTSTKPGLTAHQAAKHSFESLGVIEMPDRDTFLENASNVYTTLSYAALILRLSSAEMATSFKATLNKDQDGRN